MEQPQWLETTVDESPYPCIWVSHDSYEWEKRKCFPQELCDQFACVANCIIYNDPLYAIVTIEGSTITIEGTESSMFMDVTRESLGLPLLDNAARPVVPKIQSCKITLG